MAIILNPITLPASKMLSTMTTLIGDVRFNETLSPSDIVNDLVDSCRVGNVDFGKGIVYNFKVRLLDVENLSESSTAFRIKKPNVRQETIIIDNYKFEELSYSEYLTKDAFLNGSSVSEFLNFIMGLLEDTSIFHFYDICLGLYLNWTPGQASQTISVDQIDTTGLSGNALNEAIKWNATNIAKVMRKTMNNMKLVSNKYTDVAQITDINTGSAVDVQTCLKPENMKLVFNDEYYTNFLADALASLYHDERVGEMLPGDRLVILPTDAMDSDNATTIAWLSDKSKFAIADFYKFVLSIRDPSTTYENTFYHFAYGAGVFSYAPGVKFVANIITPEE